VVRTIHIVPQRVGEAVHACVLWHAVVGADGRGGMRAYGPIYVGSRHISSREAMCNDISLF
jgi:hypothetical protein